MAKAKTRLTQKDIYLIVNKKIIGHLKNGVIPWRQSWTKAGLPKNLITGKHYRGINVMLLASLHYRQNCFLTFKQVSELGGIVKKGEKSCPVIYWNWIEKKNKDSKEVEKIPLLRYYNVFNIDQCENIPKEKLPQVSELPNDPINSCELILRNMNNPPEIQHKEYRAYYHPQRDYINIPDIKSFDKSTNYYGTLFHELVHSSGHKDRLNRKELVQNNFFGSKSYAIEELTAEMGACYLKSYAGIPIEEIENSSAYIQGWFEKLKNDRNLFIHASGEAQRAADYILNIQTTKTDDRLTVKNADDLFISKISQLEAIRSKQSDQLIER
jgi:antirestriction protein ArdC